MDDETIVIEPPGDAAASVIWLHGLGADGHDFEPVVPALAERAVAHVRFVFPHAPMMPVTINNGAVMRAWYDIADADPNHRADARGVRASAEILVGLVDAERERGIPAERIVVAGFSQGGAIALHAGLRYPHRLAGILALSTYLPLADSLAAEAHAANREVPVFLGHGSQDPVVPLPLSDRSLEQLAALGYAVEIHTYPMPHSVCAEELRDVSNWLDRRLNHPGFSGDSVA